MPNLADPRRDGTLRGRMGAIQRAASASSYSTCGFVMAVVERQASGGGTNTHSMCVMCVGTWPSRTLERTGRPVGGGSGDAAARERPLCCVAKIYIYILPRPSSLMHSHVHSPLQGHNGGFSESPPFDMCPGGAGSRPGLGCGVCEGEGSCGYGCGVTGGRPSL